METITDTSPEFLTPADVAAIICRKTNRPVYAAISAGELRAYKFGRDYRMRPADVAAWLESKQFRPEAVPVVAAARSMRELLDSEAA